MSLKNIVTEQLKIQLSFSVRHWVVLQIMSGGSADYNREHGGPEGMDPNGVIESNWNEIVDNFDDMNLKESLLRGIYAYGFEKPSAIQQRAIIPCIKDPKGNSGAWRLYGSNLSRLHWWNKCLKWNAQTAGWSNTYCCWNTRESVWYVKQKISLSKMDQNDRFGWSRWNAEPRV